MKVWLIGGVTEIGVHRHRQRLPPSAEHGVNVFNSNADHGRSAGCKDVLLSS